MAKIQKPNIQEGSRSKNSISASPLRQYNIPLDEFSETTSQLSQKPYLGTRQYMVPNDEFANQDNPVGQQKSNSSSPTSNGLPDAVQAKMEASMGQDFSNVKINKDSQNAVDVGALAYAQGNEVHFAPGQFKPNTSSGQELIGHELAHVVQQREGRVKPTKVLGKGMSVNDDPKLEGEADQMGKKAASFSTSSALSSLVQAKRSLDENNSVFDKGISSFKKKNSSASMNSQLKAIQGKEMLDSSGKANAPIQRACGCSSSGGNTSDLERIVTSMSNQQLPVDQALLDRIHNASVADRQEILNSETYRDIIKNNLSASDATLVMSALLEGSQEWKNPTANDFYTYFVTNGGTGTMPNADTMNCWESILYSAYLSGQIDAPYIVTFYNNAFATTDPNQAIWTSLGFNTSLPQYPATVPTAGQLIFYYPAGAAVPSHIALSQGGDTAISLWSQPNNINSVQRIQVNDLQTPSGQIFVGNPPW